MGGNSTDYVVVVDQERIDPEIARQTVIKYDPLNRSGQEGGFHIDENGHLKIDNNKVMESHKMAINRYPDPHAINMIKLKEEEGDITHQFGENGFRLYGLPVPKENAAIGLLGRNGLGKSLSLEILSGKRKPNLGNINEKLTWDEISSEFRGSKLQKHFKKFSEDEKLSVSYKPQHVERLHEKFDGSVEEYIGDSNLTEKIKEKFDLEHLLDRELSDLSGGELQRVAIANTLSSQNDIYLFDEPSSFLDLKQRMEIGKNITKELSTDKLLVVEHDLATLDLVTDRINIFYGEKNGYGIVTDEYSVKNGINNYLEGYLPDRNVRFRDDSVEFNKSSSTDVTLNDVKEDFPKFAKNFEGSFELETEPFELHEEEVLAIIGENGLGKTVFTKIAAGLLVPDNENADIEKEISFKPQRIQANDKTVREVLNQHTNVEDKKFETRVLDPLEIEPIIDQQLSDLSGGELQRVAVAACLAKDSEIYIFDEPSAFLDVETRLKMSKTLRNYAKKTGKPIIIVDHDLMLLEYVADRGILFEGKPGIKGKMCKPQDIEKTINDFLKDVGITFRRDPQTDRPRANKPESRKDQDQKSSNNYLET